VLWLHIVTCKACVSCEDVLKKRYLWIIPSLFYCLVQIAIVFAVVSLLEYNIFLNKLFWLTTLLLLLISYTHTHTHTQRGWHTLNWYGYLNLLKTKRRPLYLKTQSVPRCKHFSFRLQKSISLSYMGHNSLFVLR